MPESFVQLAPDSTGKRLRTRQRTIGANTVDEPYLLAGKAPVVTTRTWVASFRQLVPRAALAASTAWTQPVFTVWNGGSNIVSIRRLSIEVDSIVSKGTGSTIPLIRLYRIAAAPTNGTQLTPVQQDTNDAALGASIVVRGDASADGTSSASALTATPSPTAVVWEQTLPHWSAAPTGYAQPAVMTLAPDDPALQAEDPLYLRANQGVMLRSEYAGASVAFGAGDWQLHVKAVVAEFTVP